MKLLGWLFLGMISLTSGVYLFGCWALGQKPWSLWKESQPDMYDGKEPYNEWAAKMHMARATQMKEEDE